MTKLCESLIKKDIDFNCADLISRGVEPDGKIMNRSDVDFAKCVFDDTRKNIVKQLILKTGKRRMTSFSTAVPRSTALSQL